jgi:hypothetical protein
LSFCLHQVSPHPEPPRTAIMSISALDCALSDLVFQFAEVKATHKDFSTQTVQAAMAAIRALVSIISARCRFALHALGRSG